MTIVPTASLLPAPDRTGASSMRLAPPTQGGWGGGFPATSTMNRGVPSAFRRTAPMRGSRTWPSRIDFRSSIQNPRSVAVQPWLASAVNSSDGGFFAVVEDAAGSANGRSQLTMQLWCEPTMITTDVAGLEHFAREPDSR
jgi:hypothetical protein